MRGQGHTPTPRAGHSPIEVTLKGGESETVEFEISPEAEGTYKVEVDGLTGSFEAKAAITPPRPAEFVFSDLAISPSEVEEGDEVTVAVTVTNVGEETGTCTIDLDVDGTLVMSKEATLEGGESTMVGFTVTADIGSHTVTVDGLTGSFKVLPKPGPVWLSPGYISGILILVLAAGAILYILYRRGLLPLQNLPKEDA